jgi:hypothetical protein
MLKMALFHNGEWFADCELPAAPRIGETIIYGKPGHAHQSLVVNEVVWDATGMDPSVRVHVASPPPDAAWQGSAGCTSMIGPDFTAPGIGPEQRSI